MPSYFYALLITHAIFLLFGILSKSSAKGRIIGTTLCSLVLLVAFPYLVEYLDLLTAAVTVGGVSILVGLLLWSGAPKTHKAAKSSKAPKAPKGSKSSKRSKSPKAGKKTAPAANTVYSNNFDDIYAAQFSAPSMDATSQTGVATGFEPTATAFTDVLLSPEQPAFGHTGTGVSGSMPAPGFDLLSPPAPSMAQAGAVSPGNPNSESARGLFDLSRPAATEETEPAAPPVAPLATEPAVEPAVEPPLMPSVPASQLTPQQIKALLRSRMKKDPFADPQPSVQEGGVDPDRDDEEVLAMLQELNHAAADEVAGETAQEPAEELTNQPAEEPAEELTNQPAEGSLSDAAAITVEDALLSIPLLEAQASEKLPPEELQDFSLDQPKSVDNIPDFGMLQADADGESEDDCLDKLSNFLLDSEAALPPVTPEHMPEPVLPLVPDPEPVLPLVPDPEPVLPLVPDPEPTVAAPVGGAKGVDIDELLRELNLHTDTEESVQPLVPQEKALEALAPKSDVDLNLPFGQPLCLQVMEELRDSNSYQKEDKRLFEELYHIFLNKRDDELSDQYLNNILSTFLSLRAVSAIREDDEQTAKDMLLRICHSSKNPDILNKAFGLLVSLYTDDQSSQLSRSVLQSVDGGNVLIVPVINSVGDEFLTQLLTRREQAAASVEQSPLSYEEEEQEQSSPKAVKVAARRRQLYQIIRRGGGENHV